MAADGSGKEANMSITYAIHDENNHAPIFIKPVETTFRIKEVNSLMFIIAV